MPVLKNRKHERFAQEMIRGLKNGRSQGRSYVAAGYRVELPVAEASASRLLHNVKSGVAARVQELAGGGARRAEITAASVLEKLDHVYLGASQAKQYSAAGRAAEAQARIAGVGAADRIEIGAVGDFGPPTVTETLQMVAREFSPTCASALAWCLDHADAEMPVEAVASFTLANMTLAEALDRGDRLREALLKAAAEGAVLVEAVRHDDRPDRTDHQPLALAMRPAKRCPASR